MKKPKTILLIDDDEDDRWLFAEALSRTVTGVKCTTVSSGQDAIALLSADGAKFPDLILLDLNMPGMDGKKCLEIIKKTAGFKDIPVVVYSTSKNPKDRDETKLLGASDFIVKPSDYNDLCRMIRDIFE
jgi:CheY-like chemotaxis protein